MAVLGRVYVFLTCAASLLVATVALVWLLCEWVAPSPIEGGEAALIAEGAVRVYAQLALILCVPWYLLHWWWAQGLTGRDSANAESLLRQAYLYGVLGASLAACVTGGIALVQTAVGDSYGRLTAMRELVALPVYVALWVFHAWIAAHSPETPGRTILRRLYCLAAGAAGLCLMVLGAAGLLQWLFSQADHVAGARGLGQLAGGIAVAVLMRATQAEPALEAARGLAEAAAGWARALRQRT